VKEGMKEGRKEGRNGIIGKDFFDIILSEITFAFLPVFFR